MYHQSVFTFTLWMIILERRKGTGVLDVAEKGHLPPLYPGTKAVRATNFPSVSWLHVWSQKLTSIKIIIKKCTSKPTSHGTPRFAFLIQGNYTRGPHCTELHFIFLEGSRKVPLLRVNKFLRLDPLLTKKQAHFGVH